MIHLLIIIAVLGWLGFFSLAWLLRKEQRLTAEAIFNARDALKGWQKCNDEWADFGFALIEDKALSGWEEAQE